MTLRELDWREVALNALCDSDNGNNPFYRVDDDTQALAEEIGEAFREATALPLYLALEDAARAVSVAGAHVYWPAGESPLGWSNLLSDLERALDAAQKGAGEP